MKKVFWLVILLYVFNTSFAQTHWKGTVNTNWNNAANWTAGVPNSSTDAYLGDASFTGSNQPTVNATASCKSLNIGGTVTTTLIASKNLTLTGNIVINLNGSISQANSTISLAGSWTNSGTYTANNNNSLVIFSGSSQTLNGSSITTFRKMTVNTGSILTLNTNFSVTGTQSKLTVNGTINPGASPTYIVTATNIQVNANGVLKVYAATFGGNYSSTPTINSGSTIEYASATIDQTISNNLTYSTLKITGNTIKSLAGNLNPLLSTSSSQGKLFVNEGTLDLLSYTANRGTSTTGGNLLVLNGASLKIGGTNTLPANYATVTLQLTSSVYYCGTNQSVLSNPYGNLQLSSSTGAAVKTMPATAFTVEGDFTSTIGSGTSVSYAAVAAITVNGNINIGTSTTFNGGSYTHNIAGNWINNGTFTGSTSTITMIGASKSISGGGVHNFNNLTCTVSGITAASTSTLIISGNLVTTGAGQFTHLSGGLCTMSGTSKTITGSNNTFSSLSVTGTITTANSFIITGDLSCTGSLSASSGIITMNGASKTISGAGTILFSSLMVQGTISSTSSFSVATSLDVSGTFNASSGTATFSSTSTLNGIANLYSVTLNGISLTLSTNSVLGIANNFTITAGALNVISNIPNTVNFNGTGAQNINATTYHHLTLSNGNTKTAAGAINTNGSLTISTGTTFSASTYSHQVYGNWLNNGTFTAGTSTVQMRGAANSTVTGNTTFYIFTINKTTSNNTLSLNNNISVPTLNMTLGTMLTGSNSVTITSTRAGSGIILGTITRTHAFSAGTAYSFEGTENTITFSSVSSVTSITVNVASGAISDFPDGASINRVYTITVPTGTYNATLRLHYEDSELNGSDETSLQLWKHSGTAWAASGKTGNSAATNYVEKSGLTNITNRWTCSNNAGVVRWTGAVSNAWENASNWTTVSGSPGMPPSSLDIVQIGTASFTNQPTITTVVSVKSVVFGSAQAATLTISALGSLTTSGNINGTWSANTAHNIIIGNQNLTVNGDLTLSDGTSNHVINLSIGSGNITVAGSLTQSGNANIIFSAAGNLNIKTDFNYASGAFTPSTAQVTYNGLSSQKVAAIAYYNLTINKISGIALLNTAATVSGNVSVAAGEFDVSSLFTVSGNISISSGAIFNGDGATITAGGNWANSGSFNALTGSVIFNGSGTQTISATTFNNVEITKSSGSAILTGNSVINSNLTLQSGILDLVIYTFNRASAGGTFSVANGTNLYLAGANNFPSNFSIVILGNSSSVYYNGSGTQFIAGVTYGNISAANGNSNAKTLSAPAVIAGDIIINNGASISSGGFSITLYGNWTNNGTFTASTGTVILNGITKVISGNTTFNRVTVNGGYTVAGSDIVYNGLLLVNTTGSYSAGNGLAILHGDLTNSGTLTSTGTTTFSGTSLQTLRLINALLSNSTGIVNFNGNISPVLNSTSSPQFATLNINNTAGINPSINWKVFVAINVNSGGIFNGGVLTHSIYGNFTNAGTVTSTGILNFISVAASTINVGSTGFSSSGTIIFGGSGQVTLAGTTGSLNNVIVENTNSNGISPSSNWTMAGKFSISNGAIFNAASFNYAVGDDIESDGTLNGSTSTFTMSSATAQLSASSETLFNHFTVTGTLTPVTDFNVSGNFVNNGTYDGSIGVLIMSGSNNATISGTTTPCTIAQLTIKKDNAAVVTQAVNLSNVFLLYIQSGTLFTSTNSVLQDPSGGFLIIDAGATLKLGGTNSLPGFSGYGLDANSNVEYAGTIQSIGNAAIYGNLIISATGTKNAIVPFITQGNFTLSNGTVTSSISVIHTIGGNWLMSGGTFTNTNITIIFNGLSDQFVSSTGAFKRLTINKNIGLISLASDVTVSTTLTFTKGIIQTNGYTLTIPSGGTVTGATQITGWVNGNLQKNVAAGTNVAKIYEIGGIDYYTPVSTVFASVTTGGNLKAGVSSIDHSLITLSGIDASKDINRYYSLTNAGIIFTTATATFNWVATDVDAGATTSNFIAATYNGTDWILPTFGNPMATSIQATGLTYFGEFAIGERSSITTWSGAAGNSNWFQVTNWSGGLPDATKSILIPSGIQPGRSYPVLNSGTRTIKNLTIQNTGSLTISAANLQISGSINNSGSLIVSAGTIELNGSAPQSIPSGAFTNNTILNLIISNDVSLMGQDTVTGTLTLSGSNKTFSTNNFLTLKSTATATARVAPINTDAAGNPTSFITGNVTVERYIAAHRAWRLLTAPVKLSTAVTINSAWQEGATSASGLPNPKPGYGTHISGGSIANGFDQTATGRSSMKSFNSTTGKWMDVVNTISPVTGLLTSAPGYMIFVRGSRANNLLQGENAVVDNTTLRVTGELNTGRQVYSSLSSEFKMMGNPYASSIDFKTFGRSNLPDAYYLWDPLLTTGQGSGGYVAFTRVGSNYAAAPTPVSPLDLNGIIQSGSAFFVKFNAGGGNLTIDESAKVSGSAVVNAPLPAPTQLRTNLLLSNTPARSLIDGVLNLYDKSYSDSVNDDDVVKMVNFSEALGLVSGKSYLSIEKRSQIKASDTIFLHLYQIKLRSYKFEFITENLNREGLTAYLEDTYDSSRTPIDLNGTTTINFDVINNSASFKSSRFRIIFKQADLPFRFKIVQAALKNNSVDLTYVVANEKTISRYEVQRSFDGITSSTINIAYPATETDSAKYNFIDERPHAGSNFYRVKSIDKKGETIYSETVKVNLKITAAPITIAPNPATNGVIHLRMFHKVSGIYLIKVTNITGHILLQQKLNHSEDDTDQKIEVGRVLASGTYYIEIINPANEVQALKCLYVK